MGIWLRRGAIIVIGLVLAIQLVPVWAMQKNPPTTAEPAWADPQTHELARRACFDCHSNQTVWPLYSKIAPASWLVTNHVLEGRETLNFSTWTAGQIGRVAREPGEITEVIAEGEMPPRDYLLLHPEARLSAAERQQLIDGLNATLIQSGVPASAPGRGSDD